jgi:polysaccharide pyruvyl transferase CsaB
LRVLISGYYGFGNVGDEAVLKAILEGLRQRAPDIGLTVLSAKPELTTELNEVRSVHRYDFLRIFSELDEAGIFLSGGGTLFQDATSRRSFWYYIGLVGLALLFGKKVMIFAQGFGPLRSPLNRLIARWLLDRVDVITLRDEDSLKELKRLGIKKPPVYVTADPTFCLKNLGKNEGRHLLGLEGVPTGKPLVGIAIRSLAHLPVNEQQLAKFLAEALDHLKNKYDLVPVFLLFQCPEDMAETSQVINLMKERSHVVFKLCRPAEMLALFSGFQFVISLRLHALVFAALNDVPMVALAYDPKVGSFARLAGQPYLDLGELSKLNETLDKAVAERTRSAQRLSALKENLVNKAKQNFDLFFEYFGKGN